MSYKVYDFCAIGAGIRRGEESAAAELYDAVRRFRYFVIRSIGMEYVDDVLHDAFQIVFQSILAGQVRDELRLRHFMATVIKRTIVKQIKKIAAERVFAEVDIQTPAYDEDSRIETSLLEREQHAYLDLALTLLKTREREILLRFYRDEQSAGQIMQEMHLDDTQFRLNKSRAKKKMEQAGRYHYNKRRRLVLAA